MENILTQIVNYLLTQSWQIAALVAVIAAVSLAVKNKSAHVRYLLWLIVLAKCLAPGLYTIPLAVLPVQEMPEPVVTAPVEMPALSIEVVDVTPKETLMLPPAAVAEPAAPTITERLAEVTVNQWLGFGWIVGAAVFVLVAVTKALRTNRWLKGQRRPLPVELQEEIENFFADVGLRTVPKVWLIKGVGQPFVWGLVRGSIYLPVNFSTSNNNKDRRGVLGHELSHVIRFDAAVNLLQIIAQAVYWFHPFVWWANKKIRAEREKCCDEMAIARLGTKAKDYSVAIVNTLIAEHKSSRPVPSLAVAGPVKNIEDRIKTIMKSGKKFYRRPTFITIVVVLVLAAVAVPTTLALTRRATTESEFESSNPATISKLLAALEDEKYANIRYWVIPMVDEMGDREPNSFLLEQLGSEDRVRRCNAGLALELLGDRRGVPAIIKELNDTSFRPTTKIKSDGAEYQEGQVRQDHYYAALLLGILGDERAVPALIEATRDETIDYQAAMSLGQIGDKQAIPSLHDMLERRNKPFPRLFAGYALAMLGEDEGFNVVIDTLNDDQQDWTNRRHAIEALGKLGNKTAVPHLIAALRDEHPNIGVSAARALGAIGDASALPALEEALQDKTRTKVNAPTTVGEAAKKAIEQIRGGKMDVEVEVRTGKAEWGEAVEGVRCRWVAPVKPVAAGTAPVIALEVENVSDNQIIWQCRSEHTWQIYPRGSERKGEGVYRGTYSPKFRVVPGEGVRLASVDEAQRNHQGAGSAIGYYCLAPGARMRLTTEYLWVLPKAGQVKIDGYLNRRNPGGGGAYPAEMVLRNRIICPALVLEVTAGDLVAKHAYEVVWSEPVAGLQAGIKYEYGKRPIGYLQDVELSILICNISEEPIAVTFSPTGHYDDLPRVRDKDDREQRVEMASDYEKYPPDTVTFPPGFTGTIDVVAFRVCPKNYAGEERRGPILYADPGKYTLTRIFRYNLDGGKELNKELTVGPIELEVVGLGEGRGRRISFLGLDLTEAPRIVNRADLPDLFEERPAGSGSYALRKEVVAARHPEFWESGVVYYAPAKKQFYVIKEPGHPGSGSKTFYGPLEGEPWKLFGMAKPRPAKKHYRFAIYLVVDPIDVGHPEGVNIEQLRLALVPVLTGEDIVEYDWKEHSLKLTPQAHKRMPSPRTVWGLPFVVVADDHRCYLGAFWSHSSSYFPKVPCIFGSLPARSEDTIQIAQGPTAGTKDPRNDPRIRRVFERLGTIKTDRTGERIGQHPKSVAVYKQLDEIVDLSGWNPEMSFSDALEELQNSVKPRLNIVVLWRDLEENAEIDRNTAINMDAISAIRLGTALKLLLKSVSAGDVELGYVVQDGVIIIATKESLPSDMVTRVYDIYGFLGPPDEKVQDRVKDLCRLIIDTVEPNSWFETGTGEGTITTYEGKKLIIFQTLHVHQKIAALLDKMRKAVVGKAIAIESRFMTVSDNFLEDLLPDSDANSVGNIGRKVSYGGEIVLPGSESAVTEFREQLANAIAHSAVSRTSEGYNITLDDAKADFLFRAIQAHRDSKVLMAPKVTVLEGERAEIRIHSESHYISGYTEPNSPSEKPEPKHDSIEPGTRVQLLAKLPDGGNNILLYVDIEISQLIGFEERMYIEKLKKYPYQIPKTEVVSSSTRLLVPDGGTVLIGGDKIKVTKEDGGQVEGNLLVLIKAESVNAQADEAHALAELER